jgi:chemotaxis protein MotA
MTTLPLGFFLTCLVIYLSVKNESFSLYFNTHALVIVLGGTVTILIMSSPAQTLRNLLYAIGDLFRPQHKIESFKNDFVELSKSKMLRNMSRNRLINYAVELWSQGVEPELFIVLISQRREELERAHIDAVQVLRNLAKYPPALGMTGTVMGLVSLFSILGKSQEALGSSLALAMTATFFGLIMANCVITPLADHLHIKHMQNEKLYTGIYQILILINRGEASSLISDEVSGRAA